MRAEIDDEKLLSRTIVRVTNIPIGGQETRLICTTKSKHLVTLKYYRALK